MRAVRTSASLRVALLAAVAGSIAGCAKPPPASDPAALADFRQTNDPLEPTNRFFYNISITADRYTLKPVAEAYVFVLPEPVRAGVHNMLVNIDQPVTWGNAILEGKPRRAGDALVRFAVNSTVGIGGFFDVADKLGYRQTDSDGRRPAPTCSFPWPGRRARATRPGSSASTSRCRPTPTCRAATDC